MSAAEKAYISAPISRKRPRRHRDNVPPSRLPRTSGRRPIAPDHAGTTGKRLPAPSPPPALCLVRTVVSAITLSLLGSTLGVYAWTVYIPKAWDREFEKLETLQLHERDLLAANETLKNRLAERAEQPGTGLVNPQPFQAIFLPRSPGTKIRPAASTRPRAEELLSRKAY